jgi:hypothetical protein
LPKNHEYGGRTSGEYWLSDGYKAALYTLARRSVVENEDGTKYRPYNYLRWQDDEWHFFGEYKDITSDASYFSFFPCDNNRLIVVSWYRDLLGDNRPDRSPFAVMSAHPDRKELRVDRSIYHGMDELRNHMSDPRFFELAGNSWFIVADKYGIIINPLTGLCWCFSLEKASLVKAGSIFKNIKPEEIIETIKKGGFTLAVLCAHPEKDGTVLLSALEEVALKTEIGNRWDEIKEILENHPNMTEKEAEKKFIERVNELKRRSPNVVW